MAKRGTPNRRRQTPPGRPTAERVGPDAGQVVHFVTRTIGTALAGVRGVGSEVGRLAVDVADEVIQVADRLAAAAGRAASNLMDATVAGVASIGGQPKSPAQAQAPAQAADTTPRSKAKPPTKMEGRPASGTRKPLARTPDRAARPAKTRRRAR